MKRMCLILGIVWGASWLRAQYIDEVHAYLPAPGQFANTSWSSPFSARSLPGGLEGTMSLGSFGGYVVFSFENPVENHPDNPYGVDFTIFGNPLEEWAEPGIVSVMKDENGNGIPDDTWYELAGCDYFFTSTLRKYRVAYSDPGGEGAADVPWTDNLGRSGVVHAGGFYDQPYYPRPDSFPETAGGSYRLEGTGLPDPVIRSDPTGLRSPQKTFGYADNHPAGDPPYTVPDNPYTTELENAGGDGFDISWAIDTSGTYMELDRVDFIRVHSACLAHGGWLGELSTEIRGAVDVSPQPGVSGENQVVVMARLPDTIRGRSYQLEAFGFENGRILKEKTIEWETDLNGVLVDEEQQLQFTSSGSLTLTAYLAERPAVRTTSSTVLVFADPATGVTETTPSLSSMYLFPNPASDFVTLHGSGTGNLQLFDLSGKKIMEIGSCRGGVPVSIAHLMPGLYMVRAEMNHQVKLLKLVVR